MEQIAFNACSPSKVNFNIVFFKGTYYGNVLGGMCQLNTPDLPPVARSSKIRYLVALNSQQMFHTLGCGMCFKVRNII